MATKDKAKELSTLIADVYAHMGYVKRRYAQYVKRTRTTITKQKNKIAELEKEIAVIKEAAKL